MDLWPQRPSSALQTAAGSFRNELSRFAALPVKKFSDTWTGPGFAGHQRESDPLPLVPLGRICGASHVPQKPIPSLLIDERSKRASAGLRQACNSITWITVINASLEGRGVPHVLLTDAHFTLGLRTRY